MKKLIYFLSTTLILSVIVSSCTKVDLPYETFNDLQKGAFPRMLSKSGNFDFFDLANSSVDLEIEYYSESKGSNVSSYNWTVEYQDVVGGGANSVDPVTYASFTPNKTSEAGLPANDISLTPAAAMAALGLASIDGGNNFIYHMTLLMDDGRVFDADNTGANIISSSPFSALFTLTVPIICPSSLEGKLDYTTTAWCGNVISSSTEWIADGNGKYHIEDNHGDFSYGAYDACYGDGTPGSAGFGPEGTLQIVDACAVLSVNGASQWGEVYWYNDVSVSADNKTLTLDWENDYGEAGVTDLVRQDGADWPPLTF